MGILDIIIVGTLGWAAYKGYKEGMLVQLGGIVGLLIGVWLASKFGAKIGIWLHIGSGMAEVVGFVIVLLAVLISMAILSHITRGLFKLAGLATLDTMGGVALSVVKFALVISVLLCSFDYINQRTEWVTRQKLDSSFFYNPLRKVSSYAFPYIDSMRIQLFDRQDNKQ